MNSEKYVNRAGKLCGPVPEGTEPLHFRSYNFVRDSAEPTHLDPTIVVNAQGEILISDTAFVALLAVSGILAVNKLPRKLTDRAWWTYEAQHNRKIQSLIPGYYQPWDGSSINLAFVRCVCGATKSLKHQAKKAI